ncbi:MAG TPA: hypothetical protein VNI84_08915 [Pyrinomonadaceae bacterium]|nr:hypothetical protein [Pyrinomonadaceae bacterium]
MLDEIREKNYGTAILLKAFSGLFLFFGLIIPAFGQIAENTQTAANQITDKKSETPILMPVLTDYKGIKIGTTADEVRDKLGKAKIDDKDGFFYDADDEMVQIRVDGDKKVRFVSVTYSSKNEYTPKYADVFGAEAQVPTKPDGSIYNLVRYPKAGYWVAYSRTAGEKPIVTVTMQKMRKMK